MTEVLIVGTLRSVNGFTYTSHANKDWMPRIGGDVFIPYAALKGVLRRTVSDMVVEAVGYKASKIEVPMWMRNGYVAGNAKTEIITRAIMELNPLHIFGSWGNSSRLYINDAPFRRVQRTDLTGNPYLATPVSRRTGVRVDDFDITDATAETMSLCDRYLNDAGQASYADLREKADETRQRREQAKKDKKAGIETDVKTDDDTNSIDHLIEYECVDAGSVAVFQMRIGDVPDIARGMVITALHKMAHDGIQLGGHRQCHGLFTIDVDIYVRESTGLRKVGRLCNQDTTIKGGDGVDIEISGMTGATITVIDPVLQTWLDAWTNGAATINPELGVPEPNQVDPDKKGKKKAK